jgi:predicted protein tyrosine phosphatase
LPAIHVCPLHLVPTEAARLKPSGLVTLLSPGNAAPPTPQHLTPDQHLQRLFNDIVTNRDGLTPPSNADVAAILAFTEAWDQRAPLLIHCFAGISRSTAAAYIAAVTIRPDLAETDLAERLRTASPSATPNILMIELADDLLGRNGRMIEAIDRIGTGELASYGQPFELPIG